MNDLQSFYNACLQAMFRGIPYPKAQGHNQHDMLSDFRKTMKFFHRSKWTEEAKDIGLEYGLETEELATL